MQSHVMVGTGIFRALSRELECEVARNNVTASRSELHLTTVSHLGRGVFFFLRLKKQQHLLNNIKIIKKCMNINKYESYLVSSTISVSACAVIGVLE